MKILRILTTTGVSCAFAVDNLNLELLFLATTMQQLHQLNASFRRIFNNFKKLEEKVF